MAAEALLLKAKGFGVFLPTWWHQKKKRLKMRLQIHSEGSGAQPKVGIQSLLDYDWKAMVADSKFPGLNPEWVNVAKSGVIGLQDHGDDVWYRNIKILAQ